MNVALYIHVPFCSQRCFYCDFFTLKTSLLYDANDVYTQFTQAIREEIKLYREKYPELQVTTLFFGGGTPNLLPYRYFEEICDGVFQYFRVAEGFEFSVECNPELVHKEQLQVYTQCGVNRISMGCQTFHNPTLHALGRSARSHHIFNAYACIREHFTNVNLDLMFGLGHIEGHNYQDDLKHVLALHPEHLSCYGLTHQSPLFRNKVKQKLFPQIHEEEYLQEYQQSINSLEQHGYEMYEVSNYAKAGYQCQHNLMYWTQSNYLGLGPSACGTINNERYTNIRNLKHYLNALHQKNYPIESREHLTTDIQIQERIILSLRMKKGLDLASLTHTTQSSQLKSTTRLKKISQYIDQKLLTLDKGQLSATRQGFYVIDALIRELL